jgi:hypothetical protein
MRADASQKTRIIAQHDTFSSPMELRSRFCGLRSLCKILRLCGKSFSNRPRTQIHITIVFSLQQDTYNNTVISIEVGASKILYIPSMNMVKSFIHKVYIGLKEKKEIPQNYLGHKTFPYMVHNVRRHRKKWKEILVAPTSIQTTVCIFAMMRCDTPPVPSRRTHL